MRLADIYRSHTGGERANNLELAITIYQDALTFYTYEAFRLQWANVQYSLGQAFCDRLLGERAENIELAIAAYHNALQVFTYETFPRAWAEAQNSLGNAYVNRIRGDQAKNIEMAITAITCALQVFSQEVLSLEWAKAQLSLGLAYYEDRFWSNQADSLELAISCYENALQVYTLKSTPIAWTAAQDFLGVAYRQRIYGERAENRERAIACGEKALQGYTYEASPYDWAIAQSNLGNAYRERICGDREENLQKAIICFQNSLSHWSRETNPEFWALCQDNLANIYTESERENRGENLERAIAYRQEALSILSCEAFPQKHTEVLLNLGYNYQIAGQFDKAYTVYASGIETLELLRSEIISGDQTKQSFAERWIKHYQNMVEICLDRDLPIEAIEYVERSKTRNLVEIILNRDLDQLFPPNIAAQLQTLQEEITSKQNYLQSAAVDESSAMWHSLQKLRKQRNELQDGYLPIGPSFKFNQSRETLDDHTAIVELYLTRRKILAFVFARVSQYPIVWQSEVKDLRKLNKWVSGYLKAYSTMKSHWQHRLTTRLYLLAKILHIDEIIKIVDGIFEKVPGGCEQLILIPHRYLHLFPLHALPISSQPGDSQSHILMDRFPRGVRYAPSCQLLQLTQKRRRLDFTNFFAIQNPTQDLLYSDLEVQVIQSYFDSPNILEKTSATKAKLSETPFHTAHCVHFSCHGYFNPNPDEAHKSALILADSTTLFKPGNLDPKRHLSLADGTVLDLGKCLTRDAIFTLNLDQCRLVVLSACETGLIDYHNDSDEYIGLISGFLFAGSSGIVSSLWAVDQVSTTFLLIKFYENLKCHSSIKEGDIASALRDAQNWLRHLSSEDGEHLLEKLQCHIDSIFPGKPRSSRSFRAGAIKRIKAARPYPFANPFYWAAFNATGV